MEETLGVVTSLGYVYCDDCLSAHFVPSGEAIYSDNAAYFEECCDRCGAALHPEMLNPTYSEA